MSSLGTGGVRSAHTVVRVCLQVGSVLCGAGGGADTRAPGAQFTLDSWGQTVSFREMSRKIMESALRRWRQEDPTFRANLGC